MRKVTELDNLEGKRVLVRVDWNVPIVDDVVQDDFRIRKSLPTIEYLLERGAKVVLVTHMSPDSASIEPLEKYVPEGAELLENLRQNPGEKNGDRDFAKFLAGKADIFVNEAFSASHRKHASIVGVPEFLPSYAGLQFVREVENLSKAFEPEHPFFLMLGGAKLETKLPLIEKFIDKADHIFIGGLLAAEAYDTYKDNPKVMFPHGDIRALDIDEETLKNLSSVISNSKFILWNGPVGKYEDEKYQWGTKEIVKILVTCGERSRTIVGGGDTLSAIQELDVEEKFTFVSTGGGAMLDFLANGTLPGIEVLEDSKEV